MTALMIFRILLTLALAVVAYVLDRKLGVRLYRWWYDLTHEHPMTGLPDRGFVYNRPARVRAFWSVMLATLVTLLSFWNGGFQPLTELLLWVLAVPAAFVGYLIGPQIFRIWQKRDTAFDAVDRWERGEIDLTNELKSQATEIGTKIRRTITSEPDQPAPSAPPPPAAEAAPSPAPTAAEPALPAEPASPSAPANSSPAADPAAQDPQELVNRYLKRG